MTTLDYVREDPRQAKEPALCWKCREYIIACEGGCGVDICECSGLADDEREVNAHRGCMAAVIHLRETELKHLRSDVQSAVKRLKTAWVAGLLLVELRENGRLDLAHAKAWGGLDGAVELAVKELEAK